MNKGIERSIGEIIGIVNSDDWLDPKALQIIFDSYEATQRSLDYVYCGWINFHYMNGIVQTMKTNHCLLQSWSKKYEMAGIRHPGVFVPKKVYKNHGVFDESIKIMADTDLILRLYFEGVKFYYPNKLVSNMSDGGVSNAQLMKACNDYKIILKKHKVSGLEYFKLYYIWMLKRYLKSIIPQDILQKYRNKI
jgi:hypothetical protein